MKMHLSARTDYAFRTMMLLAVRHPKSATIQEIATRYNISRGHLMVLVHRLGNRGFLQNSRGRGGGIRLERPASEIRLDEIVRATESGFNLVECFEPGPSRCLVAPHCRLRGILDEALNAWLAVLERFTLADLVDGEQGLTQLLGIQDPGMTEGRRSRFEISASHASVGRKTRAGAADGGSRAGRRS